MPNIPIDADVVSLSAKIVQTRDLPAYVGVAMATPIARLRRWRTTISLGYADGWPRRQRLFGVMAWASLVGRVSMDASSSAFNLPGLKAGDLVELIDPDQTIDDIAGLAGTIGYEILTALGKRFHRVYIDERRSVR